MVNGKQVVVIWHVGDLIISCEKISEVTRMIEWLESQYSKMRISRGKLHDYLGIYLDYSEQDEVSVIIEKICGGHHIGVPGIHFGVSGNSVSGLPIQCEQD